MRDFDEASKRREMDISTVAAAFVVDLDSQNTVRHARLGYGGVVARALKMHQNRV
jgi:xanthine dehydrogenase small subunit